MSNQTAEEIEKDIALQKAEEYSERHLETFQQVHAPKFGKLCYADGYNDGAEQRLTSVKEKVEYDLGDFNAKTEFQLGYQRAIEDVAKTIEEELQ